MCVFREQLNRLQELLSVKRLRSARERRGAHELWVMLRNVFV